MDAVYARYEEREYGKQREKNYDKEDPLSCCFVHSLSLSSVDNYLPFPVVLQRAIASERLASRIAAGDRAGQEAWPIS